MTSHKKVTYNIAWSVAERLTSQVLYFILSVLLARLIDPSDYGVVTTVMVIVNIFSGAIQSGFSSALIYFKDIEKIHYSTAFWSTLGICTFFYGLLFGVAPEIARFYQNPNIVIYLRVMAVQIIFQGMQSIPFAFISKAMQFKKNYMATFIGVLVAAVTALVMALNGYGIWALVLLTSIEVLVSSIVLWMSTHLHIAFEFDAAMAKAMFSYCWKLMGVDFINSIYTSLNSIIIGKKYTQADVAYYNKGYNLPQVMMGSINTAVSKVLFPVFSEQKDQRNVLKHLRSSIKIINYILYPALFGMVAVSQEITLVLYTEKWAGIVPYLRLMCLVWLFQPVQICVIQAFKSIGKSDKYLNLEIYKKILGLSFLIGAVFWWNSPISLVYSLIAGQVASVLINFPCLKNFLGYGYREQLEDILGASSQSVIMLVCVVLVGLLIPNILLRLIAKIITGIIVYLTLSFLMKNNELKIIMTMIKRNED